MRASRAMILIALALTLCANSVGAVKRNSARKGVATVSKKYKFFSYKANYKVTAGNTVFLDTETFGTKTVVSGFYRIRFVLTNGKAAKKVKAHMSCLDRDGAAILDLETPVTNRAEIIYNNGRLVSGYDLIFPDLPNTAFAKGATCVYTLEVVSGSLKKGNWEFQLFLQ